MSAVSANPCVDRSTIQQFNNSTLVAALRPCRTVVVCGFLILFFWILWMLDVGCWNFFSAVSLARSRHRSLAGGLLPDRAQRSHHRFQIFELERLHQVGTGAQFIGFGHIKQEF